MLDFQVYNFSWLCKKSYIKSYKFHTNLNTYLSANLVSLRASVTLWKVTEHTRIYMTQKHQVFPFFASIFITLCYHYQSRSYREHQWVHHNHAKRLYFLQVFFIMHLTLFFFLRHLGHLSHNSIKTRDQPMWFSSANTNANISAIHEPIPIFPNFLNFVFCFIIKNAMYSIPYHFIKNFKNQDLWAKTFQIAAISIFCYDFQLIWSMMMLLFWLWWLTRAPWFILSACLRKRTC